MSYFPTPTAFAAGTQTASTGTIVMSASNGVSWGMGGSHTITASVDAVRSISAGTTNVTGSQVVFSNSNGVSFGYNAGTITASFSGASNPVINFWEVMPAGNLVAANPMGLRSSISSMLLFPLNWVGPFPGDMTINTVMIDLSVNTNISVSLAHTTNFSFALYTQNAESLSLLNSASAVISMGIGASNSDSWAGQRYLTIGTAGWSTTPVLAAGSNYYGAMMYESSGSNGATLSYIGQFIFANPGVRFGTVGATASASNASVGYAPWLGVYSSATTAFPANIPAASVIRNSALFNFIPHVQFNNLAAVY